MQLASVDLPQPDGPAIRIFSPRLTEKEMSNTVGSAWELYWKVKLSKRRIGSKQRYPLKRPYGGETPPYDRLQTAD